MIIPCSNLPSFYTFLNSTEISLIKSISKDHYVISKDILYLNRFDKCINVLKDIIAPCYLNLLIWICQNGYTMNKKVCSNAALNGHLDILIWACANGCPWDSDTCAYAAKNGHLDIIIWARANGCPWNSDTCANAALNGHLEIVIWARENGCPRDNY